MERTVVAAASKRVWVTAALVLAAGCTGSGVSDEVTYQARPGAPTAIVVGEDVDIGYVDGVATSSRQRVVVEAGTRAINVVKSDVNGHRWKNFRHRFDAGREYVIRADFSDGFAVSITERSATPTTVIR